MTASNNQIGGTHYKDMGEYQPWDVLQHWLTPEEYRGYQKGVAIAYLARERAKGGDQDLRKALHHLQKMVEVLDQQGAPTGNDTLNAGPGIDVVAALAAPAPEYAPESVGLDGGWIEWGGGNCPVGLNDRVDVVFKSGAMHTACAGAFGWCHHGIGGDIVKWKLA